MKPEERQRYREEHYRRLREVARIAGIELPATPRWDVPGPQRAPQSRVQSAPDHEAAARMPAPAYPRPEQWGQAEPPGPGALPGAPGDGYAAGIKGRGPEASAPESTKPPH